MVMTKISTASHSYPESPGKPWRLLRYLVLGITINSAIWGLTFFYLKVTKPTYVSKWTLVLPETGSSTRVDIPQLGGASSEVKSPYSDRSQDPRAKYQVVAESDAVLEAAAKKLNMPEKKFGEPRIKVVDNSTLMDFEMKGDTPEEARSKAIALQEAFDQRLDYLRKEEVAIKNSSFQKDMVDAEQKLKIAQARLSDFKAKTGLGSKIQLEQISDRLEELRKLLADLMAQKQQAGANLRALSNNLDMSSQQAADAFVLKTDPVFQQNLKDYSDATTTLTVLTSKFLPSNPAVLREKSKQDSARAALLARSQSLLNRPTTLEEVSRLNLNGGASTGMGESSRETLFQQLIETQADAKGREANATELRDQIAALEARYRIMAQNSVALDTLERDVRIAEAVFSSALTALNVGKSRAESYPPLQMLIQPNLPAKAATPKKSFALLGAGLGSLFISSGLLSLWMRPYLLRKRKTSKSNLVTSPTSEEVLLHSTAQLGALALQKSESYNGKKPIGQDDLPLERR